MQELLAFQAVLLEELRQMAFFSHANGNPQLARLFRRLNADATQRIEIDFHHVARVAASRQFVEMGKGWRVTELRQTARLVTFRAHRHLDAFHPRQARTTRVLAQVDHHVVSTCVQNPRQGEFFRQLRSKPRIFPVAINAMDLRD